MDEIELLRAARPDVPAYPDEARETARAALATAAVPAARPWSQRWRRAWRLRWGLAATAAGLAVAVGAAAVLQQTGTHGTGGHAPRPDRTGTVVDAAQVLSLAANTVETRPAIRPRAHQWAYVERMDLSSQRHVEINGVPPGKPMVAEIWTRFDGTREASLGDNIIGVDPHRLHMSKLDHDADETTPLQDYAHLASLPTDPQALVKKLCHGGPATADQTSCVFPIAVKLLANVAMPPKLQATFYRVLATLPHIVVKRDVVDLAGRHDIAVAEAYPDDFQSEAILLDPHTYEYRGERLDWTVDPNEAPPAPGRTPPRVLHSPTEARARHEFTETIRIASGVVDRPGTRP
ncbi:hypothetical protein GCM10027176_38170 [Actinoallomurus bryophytorum]|uniref:CU044_5270 family protein n=1 Tax=Actinoallomurus bryophytorum TaxID=1490222 RepID=A0A543CJ74_9ACTN|nr:CU044_5270 family protein [Actinoallomurus bryophytorum]TQL97136.1 hypothetical protein FB559_2712 [Actinoallomurus bryophytorum]